MAEQMRQGFCRECDKYTLVKRRGVSHILHLLLSIFTIGLWVLVWLFLSIFTVGGWRCQTCGSDRIKDTGEMQSLRGWLVIALSALLILPMVVLIGGGAESGEVMQTLAPLLVWTPVVAIPVLIVMAFRRRARQRERLEARRIEVPQPSASPHQPGEPRPSPQPAMPPGMTVSEEYIERAETDDTGAEEFRRRMQQQRE